MADAYTYGANVFGMGYFLEYYGGPEGPTESYGAEQVYNSSGLNQPPGGGQITEEGSGATGVGFLGAPLYSYASLATGTLFATADWATQYYPITTLGTGPDYAQASFYDTVTFSHVPAGAMATFTLTAPSYEIDTEGQVFEEIYGGGAETTQTASPGAVTLDAASGVTVSAEWDAVLSITFPITDGGSYLVGAEVVAQIGEPASGVTVPPGEVYALASIDPAWSMSVPAGVTATTASGVPIGGVACFVAGTGIATEAGMVAVEDLRAGDRVQVAGGGWAPVVWTGSRRVDCRAHARPSAVWPVRIAGGAFGPGRPARALRLSPDHCVFVAGGLTPARCLINGATIVRERVDAVTYWHVELDRHDVILAEGLGCESYLDTGNRAGFAQGAAMAARPRVGEAVYREAAACVPLVLAAPLRV